MSAHYVCPSCRRNAIRLRGLSHTPRATFISFLKSKLTPSQDQTASSISPDKQPEPPSKTPEPKRNTSDGPSVSPPRPSLNTRPANQPRSDAITKLYDILGESNLPPRYSRPKPIVTREESVSVSEPSSQPHQTPKPSYQPQQAPKPSSQPYQAPSSQPHQAPSSQPHQAPKPPQKHTATQLDELINDADVPASTVWDFFQKHYDSPDCPALKSPPLVEVSLMAEGHVFRKLIRRITKAWRNGDARGPLPNPVEAAEKYISLRIMGPEVWSTMLWAMSVDALKKFDRPRAEKPRRKDAKTLLETMSQLMKLWQLLFEQVSAKPAANPMDPQSSPQPGPRATTWACLPHGKPMGFAKSQQLWQFGARLGYYLDDIPSNKVNRISYSALIAFDILTREGVESQLDKNFLAECKPFVTFVAQLIPGSILITDAHSSTNHMSGQLAGATVSATQIAALFERLGDASRKAMNLIGMSGAFVDTDQAAPSADQSLTDFHYKRIARAYEQKKITAIYQWWQMACQAFPRREDNPRAYDVPPKLYDLTLEALMAFKRTEQAILVWKAMIENETQPTTKTWTAMLVGCGYARDIHAMEQVWNKMLDAGFEPDVFAWSARISAILNCGKPQHGLRVLDEMGKIWVEAYKTRQQTSGKKKEQTPGKKKDQNEDILDETGLPAKPNTVVLNGAVTALARTSTAANQHTLGKVLAWGRSFGIQPDVVTYNALIRMYLKENNTREAMKLLHQMEKNNVPADGATFSIILNAVVRSPQLAAASQDEQNMKVQGVLQELEGRGFHFTAHIYSSLIDGLLKVHQNEKAAKAVLSYMAETKIDPGPHIYTSLMAHYFDKGDIEAVEALWIQIKQSEAVMDIIFYDRMIERYAERHDVDKTLSFIEHMAARGFSPGYVALQEVVKMLAHLGQWDRFNEIVDDVEHSTGVAKRGMRTSPRNVINQFWRTVEYLKKGY